MSGGAGQRRRCGIAAAPPGCGSIAPAVSGVAYAVTRDVFVGWFQGRAAQAAADWWESLEGEAHPYSVLWFHHFRLETRGWDGLRTVFEVAVGEGMTEADAEGRFPGQSHLGEDPAARWLACHLLQRVFSAAWHGKLRLPGGGFPTRRGEPVRGRRRRDAGLTLSTVHPVGAPGDETRVRRELEDRYAAGDEGSGAQLRWLTPETGLPEALEGASDERVDRLCELLGLPHVGLGGAVAAVRWEPGTTETARVPTMLDGRWPFFRPSSAGSEWGRTMDLSTGGAGVEEGVVTTAHAATPFRRAGGRIPWWRRLTVHDPTDDWRVLCAQLAVGLQADVA